MLNFRPNGRKTTWKPLGREFQTSPKQVFQSLTRVTDDDDDDDDDDDGKILTINSDQIPIQNLPFCFAIKKNWMFYGLVEAFVSLRTAQ